jgi:isopenicillin N synthase-like dioxygenase
MILSNFSEIPIVDLSTARRGENLDELAQHLGDICHHVGFLLVSGHGVDPHTTKTAFELSKRFFDLPLEQKLVIDKRQSRHFRGWEPEGAEYTNNRPDIREQIDVWTEHRARAPDIEPHYLRLLGPNQWPPNELIPGFKESVDNWVSQVQQLADLLLSLLARSLGLRPNYFLELFGNECMSLTKLIHYPPTPASQFGVNAHHDAGFLTVLAPGDTPGLEVENANGEWIPVPLIDGTLVVNLGEIMQKLTGSYFIATPHRVVTREARQSMGYFRGPSLTTRFHQVPLTKRHQDAVLASPRHANAGFMAQREETAAGTTDMASPSHPDSYGEQLWNYFSRSYPDNVTRHYPGA